MNCPNCGNELTKGKKNYLCEECDSKFTFEEIESTGFTESEKLVITHYPQMIALPYYGMLRETNETASIKLLVDVFTNILKYLALIVETDYLRSSIKNQELNDWILKLERPLISSWNIFLAKAIPVLESAGWSFTIPEIPEFHRSVETKIDKKDRILIKGGYYDANGDFIEGDKNLAMFEALVNYRNSFAHGFNPPAEEALNSYQFYRPVLDKILSRMEWCINYTIYRFNGESLIPLMGNEPGTPVDAGELKAGHDGDILIRGFDGKLQPIVPLFVTPSAHFLDVSENIHLMVYEDKTDKIIRYISPDGIGRPTAGTISKWNRLFDEKRIILEERTEETLERSELFERAKSSTDRTIKTLVETKKVMEDKLLRRPAQEGKLIAYIGGSFPVFFLRATSGAGKTNLLSIMAQTWIAEGKAVLFRKADEIDSINFKEFIRKELGLSENFNWSKVSERLGFETDPPVIIIDALNEKHDCKQMFDSIIDFAKEAGRTCKIVVSWRAINESELPEVSDEDLELIYPGTENKDNEKGLIHRAALLERLNHLELAEMWNLYAADKKRFSPAFTLNELIEQNRRFGDDLKNPLVLRLFMEVYHGRKVKGTISSINLWKDYVELLEKQNPGAKNFLMLFAKFSFNQNDTSPELHSVYTDPELGPYIRNTQVDSPYFRLKRAGVLAELRRESGVRIGFTHEGLGQYMTAQVIAAEPANHSVEVILDIAKKEMPGIERSLAYFCMKLLSEGETGVITELIKTGNEEGILISAEALTQRFMDVEWDKAVKILDEIIALDADSGIEAVLKVNEFLEENLMEELRFSILDYVLNHGKEKESKAWVDFYTKLSENESTAVEKRIQYMEHAYEIWKKAEYGENDEWEADLSNSLGSVYSSLGENDKALEYFNKSLNIRLEILGEEHPDTTTSYSNIGYVYSSLGKYNKALEYLNKCLNIRLNIYGEEHSDTAKSYNNTGSVYNSLGKYFKALEYHNKSLNIRLSIFGEEHSDTAISYDNIGLVYSYLCEYDKALEYHNKSLNIRLNIYGEEHPDTSTSYNNIGYVYSHLCDYDKALEFYNKSLNIRLNISGEEHPDTATIYSNIGLVYDSLVDYDKAIEYFNKSLNILLNVFDEEHPATAVSYMNIGAVYYSLSEYDKALEYHNKSLNIILNIYGEEHPDTAISYSHIGSVYSSLCDYVKALEYFNKSLNIRLNIYGEEYTDTAISYINIGTVYSSLGKYDKALEYHNKSLNIRLNIYGEEHPDTAKSYINIGLVYSSLGKYDKALEYHNKSLNIRLNIYGEQHPATADTFYNISSIYNSLGEYNKAIEYLNKSLLINLKFFSKEHSKIVTSYRNLGIVYHHLMYYDKALEYYNKSLDIELKMSSENQRYTAKVYNLIGEVYSDTKDQIKALEYYFKSLQVRLNTLGEEHIDTADSYCNIGTSLYSQADYNHALEYYEKCLLIRLKIFGEEHIDTVSIYNNIANCYYYQTNYIDALKFYFKCLEIQLKLFDEEHLDIAVSYCNIGNTYNLQASYTQALEYFRKALEIRLKILGEEHQDTAMSYNFIASVYRSEKDYPKALLFFEKGLNSRLKIFGYDHHYISLSYNNIGTVYELQDEFNTALQYYEKSLEIKLKVLGDAHHESIEMHQKIEELKSKLMNS